MYKYLFLLTILFSTTGCVSTIVGEALSLTTTIVAETVALPIKVTSAVIEAASNKEEHEKEQSQDH